jgi:hypothetical protein
VPTPPSPPPPAPHEGRRAAAGRYQATLAATKTQATNARRGRRAAAGRSQATLAATKTQATNARRDRRAAAGRDHATLAASRTQATNARTEVAEAETGARVKAVVVDGVAIDRRVLGAEGDVLVG